MPVTMDELIDALTHATIDAIDQATEDENGHLDEETQDRLDGLALLSEDLDDVLAELNGPEPDEDDGEPIPEAAARAEAWRQERIKRKLAERRGK